MAAARLRKTFRLPADNSDDDDDFEVLDEEGNPIYSGIDRSLLIICSEQENLITKLRMENEERNEEFKVTRTNSGRENCYSF